MDMSSISYVDVMWFASSTKFILTSLSLFQDHKTSPESIFVNLQVENQDF